MLFEAEVLKVFALVMVRFSGLVVSAPLVGSSNFPAVAKIGLAGLTAMLITPTLPALPAPLPDDFLGFGVLAMGEALIGLMMGFVMTLVFAAVQVAGEMVDMLSGFAMMNVFNPALETQVPIFGFFLFILAALYLLALDGHHVMIRALAATYQRIPIGGFVVRPELLREVSTWGRVMFYDGFLIAAPVAGALFLAYATMGLLSRVVPQIHLFVVGFPFTIALALLMTALTISVYLSLLNGTFERMFDSVSVLVKGLS